jgi:hypothetical protein|nr:MAG TPA_asm: hypothetical protein [Caudoviricetes sp.]
MRKEGGRMKCETRKGVYALVVLWILATVNGWGNFWKILISVLSILELIAIGFKFFIGIKAE